MKPSMSGKHEGESIAICLCRLLCPASSVICARFTPKQRARKRSRCSFALPSTGGAVMRIFKLSPCRPQSSSALALGCTWQVSKSRWPCHRTAPPDIPWGRSGDAKGRGGDAISYRLLWSVSESNEHRQGCRHLHRHHDGIEHPLQNGNEQKHKNGRNVDATHVGEAFANRGGDGFQQLVDEQ